MADGLLMRDEDRATYLHNLQDLAHEMTVAIHAISANALSVLEESVAKQEMLCASLAAVGALRGQEGFDAEALEIRAAGERVRALSLQYASLLKHSGKSIAVLSALCRNHTEEFQEARGARLKHQTWSCEM